MKENYQDQLKEYLLENETLLWTGKPKRGIVFRAADIILIPMSFMFGGLPIFFLSEAIYEGVPLFFYLLITPFLIGGLQFIFGRFISDIIGRENIYYGLTEGRILIKSGIFSKKIKSIDIKGVLEIELAERSNKLGSIYLSSNGRAKEEFEATNSTAPVLDLIQHPRKLYNQIIKIKNKEMNG